jgi:hypothetical protein
MSVGDHGSGDLRQLWRRYAAQPARHHSRRRGAHLAAHHSDRYGTACRDGYDTESRRVPRLSLHGVQ